MHIDWEKIREHVRENELDGNTNSGAGGCADNSHRRCLCHIDREHLTARRSQASQNGNRVDLALDESPHTAGNTDPTEQQRDESNDPNKIG